MSALFARGLFAALALVGLTTVSIADEWTAARLRGEVFVYRDGWVKLERGDVVADDSIIRTLGRGRVSFTRGAETIDLLPDSQIRIIDQTGRKFTTVMSDYGGVEIDAEVQNVEHFSVATPFLAAVVKGTHFSVSTGASGSEVSVQRGRVFVEDSSSRDTVTIVAGQTASTSSSETLIITGAPTGAIHAPVINAPPIVTPAVPAVAPVPATPPDYPADDSSDDPVVETPANGNPNVGPGNNNGNGNPDPGNGNNNPNQGPGNNNGNGNPNPGNGNDNPNQGPGNNNGNGNPNPGNGNNNPNQGPGNNNGNGNDRD
jgi:hypothetical protein